MSAAASSGFIDIIFTIDGVTEIQAKLSTFGHTIEHLAPAWETVGADLLQDFQLQFDSEGGVFGEWAHLADSTVRDRARLGYGGEGPMEVRTGRLKSLVTVRGTPGNVFEVTDEVGRFGFEDQIGAWQQYGTRKMPARKLVGLSFYRRSAIVNELDDWIKTQIALTGLGA